MNQYYTKLSFEKLENFDMRKSSLSSFVLVRNSLITALTRQHQRYEDDMILLDQVEEEQQGWLDSCFQELDQVVENHTEEEESDEEDMPLSPQDEPLYKKKTFYINEEEDEEDGLVSYDIPFLSLEEGL